MSSVGEVRDAYLPVDRETGRPRGFAFVEFATEEQAAEAIERFNDYELAGRQLRVNAAEDRPPRRPGPSRGPRPQGDSFSGGGFDFDERREPPSKPKGSRRGLRRKKRSL